MKYIKNLFMLFLLVSFSILFTSEVFAGQKKITSIGIYINQDISAGELLEDINLNIGNTNDKGINVYTSSDDRYTISNISIIKTTNRELKIGDRVKFKLSLTPLTKGDIEYNFKGHYSKSNISVRGGELISTNKKDGELTLTLSTNPIKGRLDAPENALWGDKLGRAVWDGINNSNVAYDIILKRGGTELVAIRDYRGTSIDLYPYMTIKGRYAFKVRSVAYSDNQKKYASNSEYIQSDELYIEEYEVSDGRGKYYNTDNSDNSIGPGQNKPGSITNINNEKVGWIKENDIWYYKYPDGSYHKSSWAYINNKWYLFDDLGRMQTGWQQRNGSYYYLNNPNGDMQTGWLKDGDIWYYLRTQGDNAGAVVMNSWIQTQDGKYYYMGKNGIMQIGWQKIGIYWYYLYPDSGQLAINTYINTFYVNKDGVWIK